MRLWPALCALTATASGLAWLAHSPDTLAWHADRWWQQPWTLWTASWVHLSAAHWLANLLALVAVAVLGAALRADRTEVAALLLAWPVSTLALLLWPDVRGYHGLSGLIHAAVGVLWVQAARRSLASPMALALGAGLAAKLAVEHGWSRPIGFDNDWGFNVVYAAHLTGALAGVLAGRLALRALRPPVAPRPAPP
jgi:rhomboid family GlyGly-CTERM serine protease